MANLAISLPLEVDGSFDKIRDFSTQIVRQVRDTMTQTRDRSWNAVSQTAERAKDSLRETADKAVDGVIQITDTAFHKVNQTAESAIANPVNSAIGKQLNSIQVWLDSHPALDWVSKAFAWGITHPIVSLIAIFLGIFVLRHFIKALGLFLEQTFLFMMQAPFKIGKFILGLFLIPLSNYRLEAQLLASQRKQISWL